MLEKWTIQGDKVLNLVINGIPSIPKEIKQLLLISLEVLNLVINGIPSILKGFGRKTIFGLKF